MSSLLEDRVVAALGDQYLIDREIGRGSSGVVYRATDLKLHRTVAIKVLPPDLAFSPDVRTRFIREAQTAAQLSHAHIVPIYSVDERDDIVYFVMAFIDGENVGASLSRGRWPIDRAARLIREVADALGYAHQRGVIHRDIKPDNILIERTSGRALVTDFGIARATANDTRLTLTGVAIGTPAYISPEQAMGEREMDGRSDVYSLGVVGYHVITGQPPFRANSAAALMVKHVSELPRPILEHRPDTPTYLAAAINRSLAKRPEDRWANAIDLREVIATQRFSPSDLRASTVPSPPPSAPTANAVVRTPGAAISRFPTPEPAPAVPPPGLSRRALRRWQRDQRQLARRLQNLPQLPTAPDARLALSRRVSGFRSSALRFATITPVMVLINVATQVDFPWSLIAGAVLLTDTVWRGVSIWADGVGPRDAFSKGNRLRMLEGQEVPAKGGVAHSAALPTPAASAAGALASAEVLAGPHAGAIHRAVANRDAIRVTVTRMAPTERELLPEVLPTVDALTGRVAALATTLHHLEADVSGASITALDTRINALTTDSPSAEHDRRLALLQRQRASLTDLLARRDALANQLESASLALENLKLDLFKLRSSGPTAAINDVTTATQEARAVSSEIGRLLQVGEELRRL